MEVTELKERILKNDIPKKLVFIDNCHTLMLEYLKALSKTLNRRIMHIYSEKEIIGINSRYDRNDILVVAHGVNKLEDWIGRDLEVYLVFIYLEDIVTSLPKVVFPALNKNQCTLYLRNWLIENEFYNKKGNDCVPTLLMENQEKLIKYFDNDIDQIMGEMYKLKSLEVHALDRPFEALFDCLPPKPMILKSLPWYSGGAVDTAVCLYNTYMKKLRSAGEMKVPVEKQRWYAQLVRWAIFVELGILSGTFGDYALEFFRLIESMSPDDMKISWNPPISKEDLDKNPEWKIS